MAKNDNTPAPADNEGQEVETSEVETSETIPNSTATLSQGLSPLFWEEINRPDATPMQKMLVKSIILSGDLDKLQKFGAILEAADATRAKVVEGLADQQDNPLAAPYFAALAAQKAVADELAAALDRVRAEFADATEAAKKAVADAQQNVTVALYGESVSEEDVTITRGIYSATQKSLRDLIDGMLLGDDKTVNPPGFARMGRSGKATAKTAGSKASGASGRGRSYRLASILAKGESYANLGSLDKALGVSAGTSATFLEAQTGLASIPKGQTHQFTVNGTTVEVRGNGGSAE